MSIDSKDLLPYAGAADRMNTGVRAAPVPMLLEETARITGCAKSILFAPIPAIGA